MALWRCFRLYFLYYWVRSAKENMDFDLVLWVSILINNTR